MNSVLIFSILGLVMAETLSLASYSITAPIAVFGVASILIGLAFALFGHRLFRPILFLSGFAFLGCMGYIILTRAEPIGGYPNRDTVLLCGSLAFGVVGGLLAMFFFRLGMSLIGALGGFALAMFILSWHSGGVIATELGRGILVGVLVVIGAIAVHLVEKPVIIISTSILGSYLIVIGIDVFANTGLSQALALFLGGDHNIAVFETSPGLLGLLSSMVVMIVIGIAVQYHLNRGRTFRNQD